MKRNLILPALLAFLAVSACAQDVVKLPEPDKSLSTTLVDALQNRKSERDFNPDKEIAPQQLSLILWAACGINRPESGLLTIPTSTNAQDVQAYVCSASGVSLYEPQANILKKVTDQDVRPLLADRQPAVAEAPMFILLVSDQTRFRRNAAHWGAMDTGYASQNICLMCTALGMKTVPRGIMNKEAIAQALSLPETTVVELNHPIGY